MRRRSPRSAPGRAVIALAALYALLLQVFLAPIQPPAGPGDPRGAICAGQVAGGDPVDAPAPCPHRACCLPAPMPSLAVAARPAPPPILPRPDAVHLAWTPADALLPRAPPDPAVSPRGPPQA